MSYYYCCSNYSNYSILYMYKKKSVETVNETKNNKKEKETKQEHKSYMAKVP